MQSTKNGEFKKPTTKRNWLPETNANSASITKREIQVMVQLCLQRSAKEIANNLHLKLNTVRGYIKSLKAKTGSISIVGITMYAVKHKFFNPMAAIFTFLLQGDCWETFSNLLLIEDSLSISLLA
jgi:DNA-binding CsgD family transcriptional regulator